MWCENKNHLVGAALKQNKPKWQKGELERVRKLKSFTVNPHG